MKKSRDLSSTLSTTIRPSITPSPSFPTQISMSKPMMAPFNAPATSTALNLNNSFLADLDPISNNKNKIPMNQMRPQVNQFQNNTTNSLAKLNPMIPQQPNSGNRNSQENAIALSAQEINDFLS